MVVGRTTQSAPRAIRKLLQIRIQTTRRLLSKLSSPNAGAEIALPKNFNTVSEDATPQRRILLNHAILRKSSSAASGPPIARSSAKPFARAGWLATE